MSSSVAIKVENLSKQYKIGRAQAPGPLFAVSVLIALLVLFTGAIFFRRTERTFADII